MTAAAKAAAEALDNFVLKHEPARAAFRQAKLPPTLDEELAKAAETVQQLSAALADDMTRSKLFMTLWRDALMKVAPPPLTRHHLARLSPSPRLAFALLALTSPHAHLRPSPPLASPGARRRELRRMEEADHGRR